MENEYNVSLDLKIEAVEVLDAALAVTSERSQRTVKHVLSEAGLYNTGSALPVTKIAVFNHAITGAAPDTIDLTALTHAIAQAVNATGLSVLACVLKADSANAAAVSVAEGAENGYALLGASFAVAIPAGGVLWAAPFLAEEIGATAKTIDVDGTEGDVLTLFLVFADVPAEE